MDFTEAHLKKNLQEYELCICGYWEKREYLKEKTICNQCVHKGYCFCGNSENISWFIENNKCHRCLEGNPMTMDELSMISINIRKPRNGCFVHHITEDVKVAFKRGKTIPDNFYSDPLVRFLKSIFLDYVITCTSYYHQKFLKEIINPNYRERPHQLRFWTFYSYIFLRCPDGEEFIFEKFPRQKNLYFNNKQIKNNIINCMNSMYDD